MSKTCPVCGEKSRLEVCVPHDMHDLNEKYDHYISTFVKKVQWCSEGCYAVWDYKTGKICRLKREIMIPIKEIEEKP